MWTSRGGGDVGLAALASERPHFKLSSLARLVAFAGLVSGVVGGLQVRTPAWAVPAGASLEGGKGANHRLSPFGRRGRQGSGTSSPGLGLRQEGGRGGAAAGAAAGAHMDSADGEGSLGPESILKRLVGEEGRAVPRHVGIIMDGNRRYARSVNMPAAYGHKKGKEALENVVRWVLLDLGVQFLTVYALSSENLQKRDTTELGVLFELFAQGLDGLARNKEVHDRRMCVRIIGRKESLPARLQRSAQGVEAATKDYTKADDPRLTVCLAYGGREEIVDAARSIAAEHASGALALGDITEDAVNQRLYTAELPDPDLIIRTSGEKRVSNFLLWQLAYSELFFSKLTWPEFDKKELLAALEHFSERKRRFGQ